MVHKKVPILGHFEVGIADAYLSAVKTRLFLRTALISTLIACLVVTGLNVFQVRQKLLGLRSALSTQTAAREQAESGLAKANATLARTETSLTATKGLLQDTMSERDKAVAVATSQTKRSESLAKQLSATSRELADSKDYLARYKATDMEPEQVLAAANQYRKMEKELFAARQELKAREETLAVLKRAALDPETIPLPADLKAKVVVCDPKWHFIVLDAGEKNGVLEHAEILLSRDGKFVAKARIMRVQPGRCIANVLPDWQLAEVMEGDVATPAVPSS